MSEKTTDGLKDGTELCHFLYGGRETTRGTEYLLEKTDFSSAFSDKNDWEKPH